MGIFNLKFNCRFSVIILCLTDSDITFLQCLYVVRTLGKTYYTKLSFV